MTTEKETTMEDMVEEVVEPTVEDDIAEENTAEAVNIIVSEYENRYRRLQADFDNFRKRTNSEKEQLTGFVKSELITGLLPVIDNFDRALAVETTDENQAFLEGFQMIQDNLMAILTKEGLKEIKALGEEFDPNFHQAVLNGPDDNYEDNQICAVLQKGYMVDGKVIRPAMVKVTQN